MAAAIIGIPLMGKSLIRKYMQNKYIQCLHKAGAQVKVLNPVPDAAIIDQYLEECDGFLFPGGADINPKLYGREIQQGCGKTNPVRDDFELPLIIATLAAHKPVLCICRGMQLLNIAQGGTLTQDIKTMQTYNHADFFSQIWFYTPCEIGKRQYGLPDIQPGNHSGKQPSPSGCGASRNRPVCCGKKSGRIY